MKNAEKRIIKSHIVGALAERPDKPGTSSTSITRNSRRLKHCDFMLNCLFCGKNASEGLKKHQNKLNQSRRKAVRDVTQVQSNENIMDAAQ